MYTKGQDRSGFASMMGHFGTGQSTSRRDIPRGGRGRAVAGTTGCPRTGMSTFKRQEDN